MPKRPSGTSPRSVQPSASSPTSWRAGLCARFATGGTAALRSGQMVSGRAGRALGLRDPLARRRRTAVARRRAHRRGTARHAGDHCGSRTVCRRALPRARPQTRQRDPGLRGCSPLRARRAEAAARRRARGQQACRAGRARAPDPRLRAGLGQARRLRSAAARDAGSKAQTSLHHGAVDLQARPPVSHSRRLAPGSAAAAGGPAGDQLRGLSARPPRRPICRAQGHARRFGPHWTSPPRPNPRQRSPNWCARRSPSRCATDTCACSCRRSPMARTMPR